MLGVATRLTLTLLLASSIGPPGSARKTCITNTAGPGTSVPTPAAAFDADTGTVMSHGPVGRNPGVSPGLHCVGTSAATRDAAPCTISACSDIPECNASP